LLSKTNKNKPKVRSALASTAHFVVAMENIKSMVPTASQIMTKTKTFPLNQYLTCANHGWYVCVATCVICHEQYVGQTVKTFFKRGSSQRRNWCKPDSEDDNNQMALSQHYSVLRGINKTPVHKALHFLDTCEDK